MPVVMRSFRSFEPSLPPDQCLPFAFELLEAMPVPIGRAAPRFGPSCRKKKITPELSMSKALITGTRDGSGLVPDHGRRSHPSRIPVDDFSEQAYLAVGRRLRRLLGDAGLTRRYRRLVETRYSVEFGVDAYRPLYDELTVGLAVTDCERGRTS